MDRNAPMFNQSMFPGEYARKKWMFSGKEPYAYRYGKNNICVYRGQTSQSLAVEVTRGMFLLNNK